MKKWARLLGIVTTMIGLTACSLEQLEEEKLKDIEFTVVQQDELPEELQEQIEQEKQEKMRLVYADKGYLYIAEGYGEKDTSGYSIEVKEVYETEDSICIKTELLGPDKTEKVVETKSYPFVVVKIEYSEKYVRFDN